MPRLERSNFSAGEISPWLHASSKLDRYVNGVKTARNMVIQSEAGLTRRPGTRYVLPLKTQSQVGALIPFRYSGSDSYTLVLNGGAIRFLRAGGFVVSGPSPYEVAMPWAAADLDNLRWAQDGSTVWLTCPGFEPRMLVRGASHTDWTLSTYRPSNGPVKTQNLDTAKTIIASAVSGTGIALVGVGTPFAAGHVGSVWRLDESDLSLIANWKASEAITVPTTSVALGGSTNFGDMTSLANAWDGNVATDAVKINTMLAYIGKTLAAPSTVFSARVRGMITAKLALTINLYGKSGTAPANASDGTLLATVTQTVPLGTLFDITLTTNNFLLAFDHLFISLATPILRDTHVYEIDLQCFSASGVPLLRRYNGNVYQAIAGTTTGLTPPTHDSGDVLSETGGAMWRFWHGPSGFVRITAVADATHATADVIMRLPDSVAARPTYRWFEGAWNGIDGWPELVLLTDRGLFFGRGPDWWMTTVNALDDIEQTTLDDSALSERLRARDGALPTIQWALDNGVLVLGLRDGEVIVRAPTTFEALTPTNVRAPPASREGSAAHVPAALEGGAVFIGRSRQRLHYASFDADTQKLEPVHVSKSGRHLLKGKAAYLAWQPDPYRVLWVACQDGTLVGVTLWIEEKMLGLHGHPLTNGAVEAIKSIASSDEGVSDVYMIVRRTINGATCRYVEQLGPYFEAAVGQTDAAGAWYFDCALAYAGAATATIAGLDHLEGQVVGVLGDKAGHPRCTVTGGAITLERAVTAAVIGLPIDARVVDLPRNIIGVAATTKGQKKRATHAILELVETIGGTMSTNGGREEPLELTGAANYGSAPQLFSGSKRRQMRGPIAEEAEISVIASEGFPLTLTGLTPDFDVVEDS